MTCIVGVSDGVRVIIGSDSACSAGGELMFTLGARDQKCFASGGWVFGYCGDIETMCLLRERLTVQVPKAGDIAGLYEAVRGVVRNEKPTADDWGLVAGSAGVVYALQSGSGWCEGLESVRGRGRSRSRIQYFASGSGGEVAMGALAVLCKSGLTLEQIALDALEVSAAHCQGVRGPFRFVSV